MGSAAVCSPDPPPPTSLMSGSHTHTETHSHLSRSRCFCVCGPISLQSAGVYKHRASVCFNELCSLTVGCLSKFLHCPAVTTEISISMTSHATVPQPRYAPRMSVCGVGVRAEADVSEIWMGADIDQVEGSQGEHLV